MFIMYKIVVNVRNMVYRLIFKKYCFLYSYFKDIFIHLLKIHNDLLKKKKIPLDFVFENQVPLFA